MHASGPMFTFLNGSVIVILLVTPLFLVFVFRTCSPPFSLHIKGKTVKTFLCPFLASYLYTRGKNINTSRHVHLHSTGANSMINSHTLKTTGCFPKGKYCRSKVQQFVVVARVFQWCGLFPGLKLETIE